MFYNKYVHAPLAQLVEQQTLNLMVGGSTPLWRTTLFKKNNFNLLLYINILSPKRQVLNKYICNFSWYFIESLWTFDKKIVPFYDTIFYFYILKQFYYCPTWIIAFIALYVSFDNTSFDTTAPPILFSK